MPNTRADRLLAILDVLAPDKARLHAETGLWGAPTDKSSCPYDIVSFPDGSRRVRVTTADGDVMTGTGASLDAALATLERKAGILQEAQ
jgi:hypothetical protein